MKSSYYHEITPFGTRKEEHVELEENFSNFLDASNWTEKHLFEYSEKGFQLISASIKYNYVNKDYSVFVIFRKEV